MNQTFVGLVIGVLGFLLGCDAHDKTDPAKQSNAPSSTAPNVSVVLAPEGELSVGVIGRDEVRGIPIEDQGIFAIGGEAFAISGKISAPQQEGFTVEIELEVKSVVRLEVKGLTGVKVTQDGQAVEPYRELQPGKYLVVARGKRP